MRFFIYKLVFIVIIYFGITIKIYAAITITVDGSTTETVTVYNGVQSTLEAVVTNCPSANYYYETWYYKNGASGNCSGGAQTSISKAINSSCTTAPSTTYTWPSNGQKTLCYGYNACSGFLSYLQCLIAYAVNSTDEVQAFRVFVSSNPPALSRFSISHDGAGINCSIEAITITALDVSSNPVTDYTGTIILSTSSNNGDWSIITGNGTLNNATADDGGASYTFVTSDNGVVVLGFKDTHAETITMTATEGAVSNTSANLTFYPYGFQVAPNPVGTQISGKNFNLTLTAVGNPPTDAGCTVISEYTGSKSIKYWSSYINPASNAFNTSVTINGTAIGKTEASSSSIVTTFSNGISNTISVNYSDAGQIQLHLRDDLILTSPASTQVVVGGAAFTVRPFGFYITIPLNPAASNHLGAKFIRAAESTGDTFNAVITAVAYQSADDLDNNNIPDGILDTNTTNNADLSNNSVTQNFGNESPQATISITRTHLHPLVSDGGSIGSLSGAVSLVASNGIASSGSILRYSEVGIIEINVTSSNFLGTVIQGGSDTVGRFYPDHFSLIATPSLTQRSDIVGCTDSFTYMSENQTLSFQLQAQNANNSVTQNYETAINYNYAYLTIDKDRDRKILTSE